MEFLDHSGHIFSLQSYDKKPIGYEYDENPYVFWINDIKDNQQISVNNYYVRSINILFEIEPNLYSDNIDLDDLLNIEISMDSKVFGFIPANLLQSTIQSGDINNIFTNYYDIENTKITQYLTNNSSEESHNDDIICIRINEKNKHYVLIPIYVIGYAKDEGTWSTTVMIHISYKNTDLEHNWCPITIGGVFVEQYESLIIHGKNMGINLPKEILKAVNGTSFENDHFDEALYNKKIKEYLINYVGIKGEKGNYNSLIQSVNWFGYGKKINISKLIQTDNEFKQQFIRDYFNIKIDLLASFKDFINSQYISLNMKLNNETGQHYKQHPVTDIKYWGEGLPVLEGLLNKRSIEYTNEFLKGEKYGYMSSYFLYTFNELGLKLAAMKYYLEKYFFPMFIKIKSFSLEYKVYQNDIKFVTKTNTLGTGGLVTTFNNENLVEFDNSSIYYFTHQRRYIDDILNEFIIDPTIYNLLEQIKKENGQEIDEKECYNTIDNIYNNNENNWWLVNDTCVSVPVTFLKDNYAYNCKLMLFEKSTIGYELIYESQFEFIQNDSMRYNSFVFYPKIMSQLQNNKSIYNCINKTFELCLLVNNKWYIKEFKIKTSEFIIDVGTIKYDYFFNDINYLWAKYKDAAGEIDWNSIDLENDTYPQVIFRFNNDDPSENEINITQLITNFDFFDNPSRYMSNFRQIKKIENNKVIFNHYMHDTDFINVNNLKFGYDLNTNDGDELTKQYQELLNSYQETINISNNTKYMNHVVLYDLYVNSIKKQEIELFGSTISTRVDGLLFTKICTKPGEQSCIYINGVPYNNDIDTTQIDYYLIDKIDEEGYNNNNYNGLTQYGLYETEVYSFFLKVDDDYNILTGENSGGDTNPYSYIDHVKEIGSIIFKNFNSFEHYIEDEILDKDFEEEIIFKNGEYWLNDDTKLIYKASFVDNEFNNVPNLTLGQYNENPNNYHIKIDFGYIYQTQVLNYIGFISINNDGSIKDVSKCKIGENYEKLECCNLNLENNTCSIILPNNRGIINNVKITNTKYYKYFVKEGEAYPSNPSFYWYSLDDENNIEQIYSQLNELIGTFESDSENLNDDFVNIKYNNILCKNLSGITGKYELSYKYILDGEYGDSQNRNVKLEYSINGEVHSLSPNTPEIFEVKENDIVFVYFTIKNEANNQIKTAILPTLYKLEESYIKLEYNKEDNPVELYKSFFTNAYSMIYRNNGEDTTWIDIWESKIDQVLPNTYYDMYLMHDKKHWYVIYISKYTIENLVLYYKDFNKMTKEFIYEMNDHKYILKFVKSDNRFLINRMKFISGQGINQFSKKELIAIRILNNSMLPLETITNTKWEITPLSVGCDKNIKINGTTNLAILSISNYDNEYKPGYYNINVNYSTTFKHANYKNLSSRILIK